MILIADCGSTKIDWCVLADKKVEKQVFTLGMNAVMLTEEEMRGRISNELMPELGGLSAKIDSVYFYGAGCISAEVCGNVASAIKANIPSATKVEVYSDLLAAARALCGREPGIACIMGTGSNSCLYDGHEIVRNVPPLGYILGDEGSSAYLGKVFIADMLKGIAPKDLTQIFFEKYSVTHNMLMDEIYTNTLPSRSLAKYGMFLADCLDNAYVYQTVYGGFMRFFLRNLSAYDYTSYPVCVVGAAAVKFRPVLECAARDFGIDIAKVIPNSLPGIIEYHAQDD